MTSQIHAADLLETVAGQVDGAEVYELHSLELPVRFAFGELESLRSVETAGRALRLIKDGRLGFSTTTDLADEVTLLRNAVESAEFGDAAPFQFPKEQPAADVACFDPQIERLDEEKLISLGEQIVAEIRAYDDQLQTEVSIHKSVQRVRLLNTSGLEKEYPRTGLAISIEVTRTREGDILIIYDSASSHRAKDVDALVLAKDIIRRLQWSERAARVESKTMPVVFQRMGAAVPLLPLLSGLNGRQAFLGASPLAKELGQQAFDRRLILVDDGRLNHAPRSAPFDDEGVPTTQKHLIEGGVVRHFLYDLKTAGLAGAQPTGNGFKSGLFGGGFQRPPDVAPSTWLVTPGSQTLNEILVGLDEALLVEQVIGLGQGNVMAGEFSNNVSVGFLVRNGEIIGRVKNTMIAGNVYELLRDQLIALSDETSWVFGMLHVPAIAVDGVGVAGRG
jgi:PmbA protein